jgi:CheY-like chemotaxis protein
MSRAGPVDRTILIVEDDRDIRESLADVIESEGFSVVTAANGQEGLERLRAMTRPCLILLDLMMPIMNGGEFLAILRKDVVLAGLPVVIVSALPKDARHLAPLSHQGFVKKPVSLDALLEVVNQQCGPRPEADTA